MLTPVCALVANVRAYETYDATKPDSIIFRPVGNRDTNAHIEWDSMQLSIFRDLSQKANESMSGRALEIIKQHMCHNLIETLVAMSTEFGSGSEHARERIREEFHNKKWEPRRETLKAFTSRKLWLAQQLPKEFKDNEQRNTAMMKVLFKSMPASFTNLINEIKSKKIQGLEDGRGTIVGHGGNIGREGGAARKDIHGRS